MDKPLQSEFKALAPDRTNRVVQINDPRNQFQESVFQGAMGGQKRKLDSLLTGTPMSSFYPFSSSNVLEMFRMQHSKPGFESTLPLAELTTNFTHPVTRYVKPHTDTLDAVGVYDLAIEWKDDPYNMNTLRTGAGYIQSNPMNVVNPAIYNHTIFNQQMYDAKHDYEEYLLKTPSDYWEKWTFGGIVETEQMMNGAESYQTSGFSGDQNIRTQNAAGYKVICETAKGPQFMYNVFGDNILPGGKCYAIIKKHAIPSEYNLDNKLNMASIAAHNIPTSKTPLINNVPQVVKPYQMSFVCLPTGGILPPQATMYYDELENLRRDGLAIYLGKIWSVPINHEYRHINNYYDVDPITKRIPNVNECRAFTDASEGIDRNGIMYMKLIFDCDDGISPL